VLRERLRKNGFNAQLLGGDKATMRCQSPQSFKGWWSVSVIYCPIAVTRERLRRVNTSPTCRIQSNELEQRRTWANCDGSS
jgi:hypothetical protein